MIILNTTTALEDRKKIDNRISFFENQYQKQATCMQDLLKDPSVQAYANLVTELEITRKNIELLKKIRVQNCRHVIIRWKDEQDKIHFCCAADCGYDEKSPYFQSEVADGKWIGAQVPHTFESREEGIKYYNMAIAKMPSDDSKVIIRTMLGLLNEPVLEYRGKQKRMRVLNPVPAK